MTARKTVQANPPQQLLEPDQVAEFQHFVRQRRIDAHRRHEHLRATIDKHEKTIRDLAEEAAKEQEIISRCDLMLTMDTERQAPVLSERGQE